MSNFFKVKVSSDVPKAKAGWVVDVGAHVSDPELQLAYVNLGYDLIAIAMAKLGVAMSEAVLGNDTKLKALQADVER